METTQDQQMSRHSEPFPRRTELHIHKTHAPGVLSNTVRTAPTGSNRHVSQREKGETDWGILYTGDKGAGAVSFNSKGKSESGVFPSSSQSEGICAQCVTPFTPCTDQTRWCLEQPQLQLPWEGAGPREAAGRHLGLASPSEKFTVDL